LAKKRRIGRCERKTRETSILVELNLDAPARAGKGIRTSVPFMDHMLTLCSAHGGFPLAVRASGDTKVDDHHLVEDLGICFGKAVKDALNGSPSYRRYGEATVPMDEALVQVVLDLSGRSYLAYGLKPGAKRIGSFDASLIEEFFLGFTRNVPCTLHIRQLEGRNAHHIVEAAFKSFGLALGRASVSGGPFSKVPSTKGVL